MPFLAGLIPVFLLIAVGVACRQLRLLDEGGAQGLNRLVASVALPALLLLKIGTAPLEVSFSGKITAVTTLLTPIVAVLAVALASLLGLPRAHHGALAQASMWGNLAYVAFPIVLAVGGESALQQAAVTCAVLIPMQNLVAVAVLETTRGKTNVDARTVVRILVNPIVISAAVGLGLAAVKWHPWGWLAGTLEVLANFAMPGALLALGAQLEPARVPRVWRAAALATVLKLVVMPLGCLLLLRALGASSSEMLVAVLLLAAPSAVSSYSVAAGRGGDLDVAGACVVLTTAVAAPGYFVWMLLLG